MKEKPSIFQASMLIVGSAIGAGVLALPIISGRAGLIPSLFVCFVTFLMMAMTGWIMGKKYLEDGKVQSFQQFYAETLGETGKHIANICFSVLCMMLMTIYISGMGTSLSEMLSLKGNMAHLSTVGIWIFFSLVLFAGSTQAKMMNAILVILKTVFFAVLLVPCFSKFEVQKATFVNWNTLPALFPIFMSGFCYQTALPIVCRETKTPRNLLYSILIGLGITLVVYVVFLIGCLGMIPQMGDKVSIDYAYQNGLPVTIVLGKLFQSKVFALIGVGLPIIAMSTAFIGISEGFSQFILDGIRFPISRKHVLAVLLPLCLFFVFVSGKIFVKAMVWGGLVTGVLFGILPCLAWLKDAKKKGSKMGLIMSCLLIALFAITIGLELHSVLSQMRS